MVNLTVACVQYRIGEVTHKKSRLGRVNPFSKNRLCNRAMDSSGVYELCGCLLHDFKVASI